MSLKPTRVTEPAVAADRAIADLGVARSPGAGLRRLRSFGDGRDSRRLMRDYGVLAVFTALFVVLCFTAPNFLSKDNLLNVLNSNAYIGIAACGTTLVMIGGNFDLSTGACYAIAGVIAAWLAVNVGSAVAGLVLGVVGVGVVVGLTNAFLVTVIRVHSFLATLASALILSGIGIAITGGFQITPDGSTFTWLGRESTILGIPNPVIVFVIVAAVLGFVLSRTTFGRYIYAAGGNPEAARLSGIRVGWIVSATLVVGAVCAALAGVISASVAGAGQSEPGGSTSLPLDAIAAVVIGGTSIKGGEGALWRTVIGVLFIALINNAFNLLGWQPSYLATATGLLIIVAVAANSLIVERR